MRPQVAQNGTRSGRGLLVCYPAAVEWITIDYLPSTLPLPRTCPPYRKERSGLMG